LEDTLKFFVRTSRQTESGNEEGQAQHPAKLIALVAVALILVVGFLSLSPSWKGTFEKEISSLIARTASTTAENTGAETFTIYSPLIANGVANIAYPSAYATLSNYSLRLINTDRSTFNLLPVTMSDSKAGQQHADSMLKYGYFSHFDTQGYKPYMRYTLLGGLAAVSENVAYISWAGTHFTSVKSVEDSINELENAMMYNDTACCANGHRMNILNGLHNRVSIGVAYTASTLYFVEDFENYYANMNFSVSKSYAVTMTGSLVSPPGQITQIYVTFDHTPTAETPAQLSAGPREYDPGLLIGGVFAPCTSICPVLAKGITVRATGWSLTPTQLSIAFDLSRFVQSYGAGVYTIYTVTGADTSTAITSISVFVQ